MFDREIRDAWKECTQRHPALWDDKFHALLQKPVEQISFLLLSPARVLCITGEGTSFSLLPLMFSPRHYSIHCILNQLLVAGMLLSPHNLLILIACIGSPEL
ncbi:hypothetical protein Hanom_Chr08g00704711 [Helianthus anomalus]